MIMIISDTHSSFETVNQQIQYAETLTGTSITAVVHLGDFGFFKPQLHDFFIKKKMRFDRPLYCIEGNHEDFDALPMLASNYQQYFTYLPRGSVTSIGPYRFLTLGGASYMDAMITPPGSLITTRQIEACLSHSPDSVDIIVTHDCPAGIGVDNSPGMEHFGKTGFPGSGDLMARFKPALWLFGHHHQWFHTAIDGTAYYGINKIWEGFGLLGDSFDIRIVKHTLQSRKVSCIDWFLAKCKLINTSL